MAMLEGQQLLGEHVGGNGVPGAEPSGAAALVRAQMERQGYRVDYLPEYERRYRLSFLVTRIQEVHAHVSLGVQVTTTGDNLELLEQFLDGTRRGVVHKSILIEINEETLLTGGIPVAIAACSSFLFDRRYSHFKSIGLRIFEDCTFHLFDIEENVRRLRRDASEELERVGQAMVGSIIAYFTDKGFGFIEANRDQKFFFHIANVVDDELRLQLPSYIPGDILPVSFKSGGSDGKKYPKAVEVQLEGEPEVEDDGFDDGF